MEKQVSQQVKSQIMFACKYISNGCDTTLPRGERTSHEDSCHFRPHSCPSPGSLCKWKGSLEQVLPHLQQMHKGITILEGDDIVFLATDVNMPGWVDWVMMQTCFGHHFLLVLEKQKTERNDVFCALVQLIGTRKQAAWFTYRLELQGQKRRLLWEATPRSIDDGIEFAFSTNDCLLFDAQHFANDGNLSINVTIYIC